MSNSNVRSFGPGCGQPPIVTTPCVSSSCETPVPVCPVPQVISPEELFHQKVLKLLCDIKDKNTSIHFFTTCLTVIESGTWGEAGDTITEVKWFDTSSGTAVPYGTTFFNVNLNDFVSGVTPENSVPCSNGGSGGDVITAFEYPICDAGLQKLVRVCLDNCSTTFVSFLLLDRTPTTEPADWDQVQYGPCVLPVEGAATAENQLLEIAALNSIDEKITVVNTSDVEITAPLPAGTNAIGHVEVDNFPAVQPVSFTVTPGSPNSPDGVNITTSSTEVVASNLNRKGLEIQNISSTTISFAWGSNPAILYSGITLLPGGTWNMDSGNFNTESLNAIGLTNVSNALSIQEYDQ